MMLNNELGSIYIDNNNDVPKYLQSNPNLNLAAAPYPTDKQGSRYYPYKSVIATVSRVGAVITSACKHPVEAVRFLDYLYTKEASDLMYWGVKDESYTVQNDGTYKFTDLIMNNPDGKTPYEAICKYMTNTGFVGLHQYQSMVGLESNFPDRVKAVKDKSVEYSIRTDKSPLIPYLPATYDERKEMNEITADLNTYLDEMYQKFVMGYEPMEKYDEFVNMTKRLGIERYLEISQQVYDRAHK
jgi:putative aldouronate transport system substrate-binding protein